MRGFLGSFFCKNGSILRLILSLYHKCMSKLKSNLSERSLPLFSAFQKSHPLVKIFAFSSLRWAHWSNWMHLCETCFYDWFSSSDFRAIFDHCENRLMNENCPFWPKKSTWYLGILNNFSIFIGKFLSKILSKFFRFFFVFRFSELFQKVFFWNFVKWKVSRKTLLSRSFNLTFQV